MAQSFPPVNKIFDDLDKFRDFCRFEGEGYPFDEKDLYNNQSTIWQAYQRYLVRKNRPRFNNGGDNRPRFNNNGGGKKFYDRRGNQ